MPRKYTKRITPEERAAIGRANATRKYADGLVIPLHEKTHNIRVTESVYNPLNEKRGRTPWNNFLARLAGLDPRPDRRFIRKDGTFSPPKS